MDNADQPTNPNAIPEEEVECRMAEDAEDAREAAEALARIEAGQERTYAMAEVAAGLGIDLD